MKTTEELLYIVVNSSARISRYGICSGAKQAIEVLRPRPGETLFIALGEQEIPDAFFQNFPTEGGN